MNIKNIATGTALTIVMASASVVAHAQTFGYSSVVNPTVITTTTGGTLTFTGSSGTAVADTDVTLSNIKEAATPIQGMGTFGPTDVSILFTLTPISPAAAGQNTNVTGVITGKFSYDQTTTKFTFTSPDVTLNYGSAGVYTISDFSFTKPGPTSTGASLGAIAATVSYTPAVPEPSSVAAFGFVGLGMMGLMLRARKSRGNMAA